MVGHSREVRKSSDDTNKPPTPPSRRGNIVSSTTDGYPGANHVASGVPQRHTAPPSEIQTGSFSPSKTSDIPRKPAPPVPKKPALLSTLSTGLDIAQVGARRGSKPSSTDNHNSGSQRSVRKSDIAIPPPPPRPRQNDFGTVVPKPSSVRDTMKTLPNTRQPNEWERPPSAPLDPMIPSSRRTEGDSSRRDLLDEDNFGAKAIPSLQPSRPS